jgi:hypothetical protein
VSLPSISSRKASTAQLRRLMSGSRRHQPHPGGAVDTLVTTTTRTVHTGRGSPPDAASTESVETATATSEPSPAQWDPPVHEDEDLPEDEDPANLPHIATVTLAEIYFQQGLKEQAAQIYRQLLERQPGDPSTKRRLEEIETSIAGPDPRATDGNG